MADEKLFSKNEEKFDRDAAASLVKQLRGTFYSGKTKSYEWRVAQIKSILRMLVEKERDIIDALHKDLSKPESEAYVAESIGFNSTLWNNAGEKRSYRVLIFSQISGNSSFDVNK